MAKKEIKYEEAVALLEVGDKNRLGLTTQTINAVSKNTPHKTGTIVEFTHRNWLSDTDIRTRSSSGLLRNDGA